MNLKESSQGDPITTLQIFEPGHILIVNLIHSVA